VRLAHLDSVFCRRFMRVGSSALIGWTSKFDDAVDRAVARRRVTLCGFRASLPVGCWCVAVAGGGYRP